MIIVQVKNTKAEEHLMHQEKEDLDQEENLPQEEALGTETDQIHHLEAEEEDLDQEENLVQELEEIILKIETDHLLQEENLLLETKKEILTTAKDHTKEEKKEEHAQVLDQDQILEAEKKDTQDQADTLHLDQRDLETNQNHLLEKELQELLKDTKT